MSSNLIFQNTLFLVLMLLWCIDVCVRAGNTFDVTKYGALVDGKSDNSKAFLNAWGDACKNGGTLLIPSGHTFLVNRVMFEGECKGDVVVQVDGNLKAPDGDNDADAWITFHNVNGLTIRGTGTFDGNGAAAWGKGGFSPRSIALYYVTNANIQGVTSLNSKGFHYAVLGCKTLTFKHITIKAPASSPNTDGIHIEKSSNVHIIGSNIGTGDDCVSIGQGSKNVNVTGVDCGPGHGFSIGSIGKKSSDEGVSGVHITGGSLTSTQNGLRIKTWVPSPFLTISDVTFHDINMKNTGNPIIIDQHYCNGDHKCENGNSKVQINNVKFSGITGTSASQIAVFLDCSKSKPCQGIAMNDINLNSNGGGQTTSKCANAHVSYSGTQNPPACSS